MKIAVLVIEMEDGKVNCIPNTSILPLIDAANKVRATGMSDGKPVKQGAILCSWKPLAQKRFRCELSEQKKSRLKAEAKAKADAEKTLKAEAKTEGDKAEK